MNTCFADKRLNTFGQSPMITIVRRRHPWVYYLAHFELVLSEGFEPVNVPVKSRALYQLSYESISLHIQAGLNPCPFKGCIHRRTKG